jgi:hypothetical protein
MINSIHIRINNDGLDKYEYTFKSASGFGKKMIMKIASVFNNDELTNKLEQLQDLLNWKEYEIRLNCDYDSNYIGISVYECESGDKVISAYIVKRYEISDVNKFIAEIIVLG